MNFNTHLQRFLFRVGSGVRAAAKRHAPLKTGNLKKDIQVFDDKIQRLQISVGNTKLAPYAKFVYFGTKPHIIKPKKTKALATPLKKIKGWSGKVSTHDSTQYAIFGKAVKHPGTKANPYLHKAFSEYIRGGGFEKAKEQLAKNVTSVVASEIKMIFKELK
ncbi:HK97 gp10 family phage protein [Campylobacter sp. faydin G-140]|uniref:HK97-gp10 family putative phage morphogenesis protein n=1 Tax=Campylobacter anatolicus TaxID=2829105 RepID=UPI001B931D1D|nr:HK97-gp10 family putative phage morphogenesis protein [Campylobacter anatolicus]MBR8466347.1 HK97 gp10 family phage protein [Campylobacter anatolicus]